MNNAETIKEISCQINGAGTGVKDQSTNRDLADVILLSGVVVCPSAKPPYSTILSMLIIVKNLCKKRMLYCLSALAAKALLFFLWERSALDVGHLIRSWAELGSDQEKYLNLKE